VFWGGLSALVVVILVYFLTAYREPVLKQK